MAVLAQKPNSNTILLVLKLSNIHTIQRAFLSPERLLAFT